MSELKVVSGTESNLGILLIGSGREESYSEAKTLRKNHIQVLQIILYWTWISERGRPNSFFAGSATW